MRPKVIMPINCAIGVFVRTTVQARKVPSTNEKASIPTRSKRVEARLPKLPDREGSEIIGGREAQFKEFRIPGMGDFQARPDNQQERQQDL